MFKSSTIGKPDSQLSFTILMHRLSKLPARFNIGVCAILCIIGPISHLSAAERFPNFDRREDAHVVAQKAVNLKIATAKTRLESKVVGLRVQRDSILNAPKFIASNHAFLTGVRGTGGALSGVARRAHPAVDGLDSVRSLIDEYQDLFGFGAATLQQAKITRDETTPATGQRTIVWQQELDGIPVFESIFKTSISARGEVMNIGSAFLPNPTTAANLGVADRATAVENPKINAVAALAIAAKNVGAELNDGEAIATDTPQGAVKKLHFHTSAHLLATPEMQLVWLPMDANTLRLCWKTVLVSRSDQRMYQILVDSQTGEVLVLQNLSFDFTAATYNVFTGESPTPMGNGLSSPSNTQPATVGRQSVTLPALSLNASPFGWINDGANTLVGNNVNAHTDTNGDHVADANSSPTGSPTRVFDYPIDFTQNPANNVKAATTNLFYWCNVMHDTLYGYGFTEAAGNLQQANSGRGGTGGDSVQAECQSSTDLPPSDTTRNNALTSVGGSDGSAAYIEMFIWDRPYPNRDGSFDATVICHEYAHCLSTRLVGGGVGISNLATQGMGEGWSDFVAICILASPEQDINGTIIHGAYVSKNYNNADTFPNYYYGNRRHPYSTDLAKDPVTFKDIDPNQADPHISVPFSPAKSADPSAANEVHNIGEVWCAALVEVRANLIRKLGFSQGNTMALQLVIDGMKNSPANPNFIEARDAIYQAEMNLTHGDNHAELENGFAKRGLGVDATAPSSITTTGVVESFRETIPPVVTVTTPAHNSVISAFTSINGTATDGDGSGLAANSINFTLYNVNSQQYWTASGWSDTATEFGVTVDANTNTWTYSGVLPSGADLRSGIYLISAFTHDNNGNNSPPQGGVNNISFTVDNSPPTLTINSPADSSTVTNLSVISGTSIDDTKTGGSVLIVLHRLSDDLYWDGTNWVFQITSLTTNFNSQSGAWSYGSLPQLGSDPSTSLTNGAYDVFAVATDAVGNQSTADNKFTVDFSYTWTGATMHDNDWHNDSNRWDTAENWSPFGVPGPGDKAIIAINDTIDLVTDRTLRAIVLGSGSINNHAVTVTGVGSIWSGGQMVSTNLNVLAGATLSIDTAGSPVLNAGALMNAGTVNFNTSNVTTPSYLLGNSGATITNQSTGVIQIDRDGTLLAYNNSGAAPTLTNSGVIVKTTGTGTADLGGFILQNQANGSFGAAVGTLLISNGMTTLADNSSITGPGNVRMTGSSTFNGSTLVTADLRLRGNMAFNAASLVQNTGGRLRWDTGTFTGTCSIAPSSTLEVDTAGSPQLDGGTLLNAGTVTLYTSNATTPSYLLGTSAATIINQSGALMEIMRDGTVLSYNNSGGLPMIINHAGSTLVKTLPGTGRSEIDWSVDNNGTVIADVGTLALSGGSSVAGSTGDFKATAWEDRVEFGGGIHHLKTGAKFSGTGRGLLTSGTLTLDGAVSVGLTTQAGGGFDQSGGILNGVGNLSVASGAAPGHWSGGTVSTTYNLGSGASLSIDTAGSPVLNAGALMNAGTVNFNTSNVTTPSTLLGNSGATITNLSTGVIQIDRDGTLLTYNNSGAAPTLKNSGVIVKTAGTGTTDLGGIIFQNQANGSFGAAVGTLLISNGATTLADNSSITGPGNVRMTGSSTFNGSTLVTADLRLQGNMAFNAASLVQNTGGRLRWDSGTFTGTLSVAPSSTLEVDTAGSPVLSGGALINAGTVTLYTSNVDSPSYLTGNLGATITNQSGGVMQIARGGSVFFYNNYGSPPTLVNAGTLRLGPTPAAVTSNWNYSQSSTGVLDFALAGTNAATPQFSQFLLSSSAVLGGTLSVTPVNGFVPAEGNSFPIVTFNNHSGDFASIAEPIATTGVKFTEVLTATSLTLNASLTNFGDWAKNKFGVDASNPLIAGPNADPDHDGISNALEYAFNLDPLTSGQAGLPIRGTLEDPITHKNHLGISYRRLIGATDDTYMVRVSTGLMGAWDETGSQLQQVGTPVATGDGATELVTVRVAAPMDSAPKQFLDVMVNVH